MKQCTNSLRPRLTYAHSDMKIGQVMSKPNKYLSMATILTSTSQIYLVLSDVQSRHIQNKWTLRGSEDQSKGPFIFYSLRSIISVTVLYYGSNNLSSKLQHLFWIRGSDFHTLQLTGLLLGRVELQTIFAERQSRRAVCIRICKIQNKLQRIP